jgi:FkbM family methyltransferase
MSLYTLAKRAVPLAWKIKAHSVLRGMRKKCNSVLIGLKGKKYNSSERRKTLTICQPFADPDNELVKLVKMQGFDMYVMTDDYIGQGIISSGDYEPHITSAVVNTLKTGDVFLDLGANLGYFSLLAANLVGNSGKVIAFEPNPQNLQLIYASMLRNQFSNITVYPFAASDQLRIIKLLTVGSNAGVVMPLSPHKHFHLLAQSVAIDTLLHGEKQIDLIKIDIEAHEPFALTGMDEVIRKHRPIIITEFHPFIMEANNHIDAEDYLRQITEYGYRLSIIESSGRIIDAPDIGFVMTFWKELNQGLIQELIHLDLLARPI